MIDDDDVWFFALAWPIVGPVTAIIFVLVVCFLACESEESKAECAAKVCASGSPKVIKGDCLCVEMAK